VGRPHPWCGDRLARSDGAADSPPETAAQVGGRSSTTCAPRARGRKRRGITASRTDGRVRMGPSARVRGVAAGFRPWPSDRLPGAPIAVAERGNTGLDQDVCESIGTGAAGPRGSLAGSSPPELSACRVRDSTREASNPEGAPLNARRSAAAAAERASAQHCNRSIVRRQTWCPPGRAELAVPLKTARAASRWWGRRRSRWCSARRANAGRSKPARQAEESR
jgi:hypothetical protein